MVELLEALSVNEGQTRRCSIDEQKLSRLLENAEDRLLVVTSQLWEAVVSPRVKEATREIRAEFPGFLLKVQYFAGQSV